MHERSSSIPRRVEIGKNIVAAWCIEKLKAVRPLEEATKLKIMPAEGKRGHARADDKCLGVAQGRFVAPSPSLMSKQMLGMSRDPSLVDFINLLHTCHEH